MKYQVMPPLSTEEYEALKTDISENGVLIPVEYDENGNVLDGYHREQICRELGITDFPRFIRKGMTEEEKVEHAYRLNYKRRHITREQKQKDAEKMRRQGWSYRRIAGVLGVVEGTIRYWLGEEGAQIYAPETVTGTDGKQYPARRPEPLTEQSLPSKADAEAIESPGITYIHQEEELILPPAKAHVSHNSGNNEWYTPAEYIEVARETMGSIDTDPASCEFANKTVKASVYYDVNDNGLSKDWEGNVWMNPPYGQPEILHFAKKLVTEIEIGNTKQACVLVNNATETNWFQLLLKTVTAVWFIDRRIKYIDITGTPANSPLQGQCMMYFGSNVGRFKKASGGVVYANTTRI